MDDNKVAPFEVEAMNAMKAPRQTGMIEQAYTELERCMELLDTAVTGLEDRLSVCLLTDRRTAFPTDEDYPGGDSPLANMMRDYAERLRGRVSRINSITERVDL